MYGMRRGTLRVVEHDPSWAEDFRREHDRIREALSFDATVKIEHIGSTSIPIVRAKPIIDIAIGTSEEAREAVTQRLISIGYEYRGAFEGQPGHYYLVRDVGQVRMNHIHLWVLPNKGWDAHLRFRDVLRSRPDLAKRYDEAKVKLAEECGDNKILYAELKERWVDTFIGEVMATDASRQGLREARE